MDFPGRAWEPGVGKNGNALVLTPGMWASWAGTEDNVANIAMVTSAAKIAGGIIVTLSTPAFVHGFDERA